jgi:hypothetical protein
MMRSVFSLRQDGNELIKQSSVSNNNCTILFQYLINSLQLLYNYYGSFDNLAIFLAIPWKQSTSFLHPNLAGHNFQNGATCKTSNTC